MPGPHRKSLGPFAIAMALSLLLGFGFARALSATDRTYVLNSGAIALSGRSSELTGTASFDAAYFGLVRAAGAP